MIKQKKQTLILMPFLMISILAGYALSKTYRSRTSEAQKKQKTEALLYEAKAKKCYQISDFVEAKNNFYQALSKDPQLFTAYCGLGILAEEHDHNAATALNFYKKALAINPRHIQTYLRISDLLTREGHHEKADAIKNKAFKLDARKAWFYDGQNHFWNGKLEEALTCYQHALDLTPKNHAVGRATILSKIGTLYEKQNKTTESLKAYKESVDLCPNKEELHKGLACAYLAMGDYVNWAKEYEWRTKEHNCQKLWQQRNFKTPWDGIDSLKEKTILLVCENGFGDMIQYIRFAPLLKKKGATLIALLQKPLIPLFSRLDFLSEAISFDTPTPKHDYTLFIQSLPFSFPTTQKTLPQPPYLVIEDSLKNYWKEQLASDKKFKVGLCWQTPHDHIAIPQSRRALDQSCVMPLFSVPGISFYSLQMDPISEPMKNLGLKSFPKGFDKQRGSFIDSAAVIHELDLIITVDTSLAHLAGAFNRPVWVMLPVAADVRWMIDKSETPWYPSMKLFRQKSVGDWRPVIKEIRKELKKKVRLKGFFGNK